MTIALQTDDLMDTIRLEKDPNCSCFMRDSRTECRNMAYLFHQIHKIQKLRLFRYGTIDSRSNFYT